MAFSLGPRSRSAGTRLVCFDSIGSTNTEALVRARDGEQGQIWFVAAKQTAGRGRRNRPWFAPPGNLYASILEVLDVSPAVAATLGFAAGLALESALRQVSQEAVLRAPGSDAGSYRLKWPNDVLAGQAKLSGILLEAEVTPSRRLAVVVGIGVNVVASPDDTPYPATSLRALGVDASAEDLFFALSDGWTEFRGIWDSGRGFGEIRRLWLARAAGVGETVSIRSGDAVISGIFDTIDETGCMIVVTADRRRIPIAAGDVHFGSTASAR